MKIVFLSNYFNHHQKPLSDALYNDLGDNYRFIETEPMDEERIKLGYKVYKDIPYTIDFNDPTKTELCRSIINEADVVIYGSAPYELIQDRLNLGKLTFLYSERIFKGGLKKWKLPIYTFRYFLRYGRYKNFHLLAASAYSALDYNRLSAFKNRVYKWGYFPEVKSYDDISELINKKEENSILWCGRFIDWKRPELLVEVARRLKNEGYSFKLNVIGTGVLEESIKASVKEKKLENEVIILGSMSPDQVRTYMEKSRIYLFTSDRNEGWGAVLNEAMNSACAVVASHAIGSVPFLLDDMKNGIIYDSDSVDDLYIKVKKLLDDKSLCAEIGRNAYDTMKNEWNANNAADKLLVFCEKLLREPESKSPYPTGVCSKADKLKDDWYK